MTEKKKISEDTGALHQKAEDKLKSQPLPIPEDIAALSPEQIQKMVHELRMHQIELEMQNDELRTAQGQIEAGLDRYFDLYDTAPVGYCTLSEKGLILEANLTTATLLGTARSVLVKQPIFRFILNEDQDIYYLHRKKLFRTGEPQECELRLVKSDGALFWAHLTATAIYAEDSAPVCRVVLSDITERKRGEAEKAGLEAKVQQLHKAESLGRMAGAFAHHFNNQLYVVIGSLELVLDVLPGDAEIRGNLIQSKMGAKKAAELSQQMLTYIGQTPGKHEPIDLSEACRQNLSLLQAAIPKGITINIDFPDSGPVIRANEGQINQVLANLITNAWESISNNQGSIGLTIRTGDHVSTTKHFPIDWQTQDMPYTCLEISDTGCGISKDDIVKIFDPFYTTKFTGRGMGLPITMGILKTHNGCITVDSEPESGSVFRVYLPVTTEKKPVKHEKVTTPKGNVGNGGTVLLVEDEASVRNMAKKMLIRLGYKVIEAQDGVEAVRLFQEHQNEIDCVLSDLTMPRMNGWETLTALREKGTDVPVILASGYDENTVMAGDHPELPQGFLNKPYSMAALKDVLMEVIKL